MITNEQILAMADRLGGCIEISSDWRDTPIKDAVAMLREIVKQN